MDSLLPGAGKKEQEGGGQLGDRASGQVTGVGSLDLPGSRRGGEDRQLDELLEGRARLPGGLAARVEGRTVRAWKNS